MELKPRVKVVNMPAWRACVHMYASSKLPDVGMFSWYVHRRGECRLSMAAAVMLCCHADCEMLG
jgi:hypothetical protein